MFLTSVVVGVSSVVAFQGSLISLVVLVSCDGAASEWFNGIGIDGVDATEGGLGDHGSPVGFTNAGATSIEIDGSME